MFYQYTLLTNIKHGNNSKAVRNSGTGLAEVRICKSVLENLTDSSSQIGTALPDKRAPQITAAPSHSCFTYTSTVPYTGKGKSRAQLYHSAKSNKNQCTAQTCPCVIQSTLEPVWGQRQ